MIKKAIPIFFIGLTLSGCNLISSEPKLQGVWVQDIPTSTTDNSIQVTTSNSVLTYEKNGDVKLSRQLDLKARGLPPEGISIDVVLSGQWRLENDVLIHTLEDAKVNPRHQSDAAQAYADSLRKQAAQVTETRKTILVLEKDKLILQDFETELTDVYSRD